MNKDGEFSILVLFYSSKRSIFGIITKTFMKSRFIVLCSLILSASVTFSQSNEQDNSLLYSLKLADAYQSQVDESLSFKMKWGEHKEDLFINTILKRLKLDSYFNATEETAPEKMFLLRQIFMPVGQRVSYQEENKIKEEANAVFEQYLAKPSNSLFGELIKQYSFDKNTKWVSQEEETSEFQTIVELLSKGEISRPFITPRGIHIVQKLDEKTVRNSYMKPTGKSVQSVLQDFNMIVHEDAKRELLFDGFTKKTLITTDYQTVKYEDFKRFSLGNSTKGDKSLWDDFLKYMLIKDLKLQFVDNPDYKMKLNALYEKEMIDAIYQKKVVNKALSNPKGVEEYYLAHQSDYYWDFPKFQGVLLFCKNKKVRKQLHTELSNIPLNQWEEKIKSFNANEILVHYELGEFELGKNAAIDYYIFGQGKKKEARIKGYTKTRIYGEVVKGPKTLDDIRDKVTLDYYEYLNREWEKELYSSYKSGNLSLNFLKSVNNQASN